MRAPVRLHRMDELLTEIVEPLEAHLTLGALARLTLVSKTLSEAVHSLQWKGRMVQLKCKRQRDYKFDTLCAYVKMTKTRCDECGKAGAHQPKSASFLDPFNHKLCNQCMSEWKNYRQLVSRIDIQSFCGWSAYKSANTCHTWLRPALQRRVRKQRLLYWGGDVYDLLGVWVKRASPSTLDYFLN